jgi:hypothetical protein
MWEAIKGAGESVSASWFDGKKLETRDFRSETPQKAPQPSQPEPCGSRANVFQTRSMNRTLCAESTVTEAFLSDFLRDSTEAGTCPT